MKRRGGWDTRAGGPATLLDVALNATSGLRLRGQVTANAKDASPLAAMIAKNTAIPRFVLDAISTEGLVATGNMLVNPSTFQAESVTAHAAEIDVGFELAELGAEQEWALLLDVGAVCAGIDVSGSQTEVLLFGATPWFREEERVAEGGRAPLRSDVAQFCRARDRLHNSTRRDPRA